MRALLVSGLVVVATIALAGGTGLSPVRAAGHLFRDLLAQPTEPFPTLPPTRPYPTLPSDVPTPSIYTPTPTPTVTATATSTPFSSATRTVSATPTVTATPTSSRTPDEIVYVNYVPYASQGHDLTWQPSARLRPRPRSEVAARPGTPTVSRDPGRIKGAGPP